MSTFLPSPSPSLPSPSPSPFSFSTRHNVSSHRKVELARWSKRWNRGDTCSSTRLRSRASGDARSHSLYLISTSRCTHSQNSVDEVLKSSIRGVMTVSQSPNNKAAFSAEGEGSCGSSKFLIASGSEAATDSAAFIKFGWSPIFTCGCGAGASACSLRSLERCCCRLLRCSMEANNLQPQDGLPKNPRLPSNCLGS